MPRFRRTGPVSAWVVAATLAVGAVAPAVAQVATPVVAPGETRGCAAGSSSIGDAYFPFMGNSGYDARHYALDLDIGVEEASIRAATARMQATATIDLCAFNLDFNGLEIDGISVDGLPAGWSRNGQELTVEPARPLARGADFVVEVRYHGTPYTLASPSVSDLVGGVAAHEAGGATPGAADAEVADDGGFGLPFSADMDRYGWSIGGWWTTGDSVFVVGEPRGAETWFPVNGHPADKATYTIALTVDEPFAAVANGPLAETIDRGEQTTFVYAAREPMSSYLVTLQAGRFEVVEDAAADGTPLRYAFAAGVPADQRDLFVDVQPAILEFFAHRFGPYPFDLAGASVVAAPLPFALETQTMPVYGAMVDGGTGIDAATLAAEAETIAHETAHQWFGNAVSPLRWEDVYLNEGLAQYGAYLWVEHRDGPAALEARLRASYDRLAQSAAMADPAMLDAATGADILAAIGPLPEEIAVAIEALAGVDSLAALEALPAREVLAALEAFGVPPGALFGDAPVLTGDPGPDDLFSVAWVYERGSLATHALRREVGDAAFFAILREWAARYGGGNATVRDFIALSEEISGRELDPLFDAWLYQAALPPYPG